MLQRERGRTVEPCREMRWHKSLDKQQSLQDVLGWELKSHLELKKADLGIVNGHSSQGTNLKLKSSGEMQSDSDFSCAAAIAREEIHLIFLRILGAVARCHFERRPKRGTNTT